MARSPPPPMPPEGRTPARPARPSMPTPSLSVAVAIVRCRYRFMAPSHNGRYAWGRTIVSIMAGSIMVGLFVPIIRGILYSTVLIVFPRSHRLSRSLPVFSVSCLKTLEVRRPDGGFVFRKRLTTHCRQGPRRERPKPRSARDEKGPRRVGRGTSGPGTSVAREKTTRGKRKGEKRK